MHSQPSQMNILAALARNEDTSWFRDELAIAWRTAQDEAVAAYQAWRDAPGRTAHAVYQAAQDRANQAQDVLAAVAEADHATS